MQGFIEMLLARWPQTILSFSAVVLAHRGIRGWWVFLVAALLCGGFYTNDPEVMKEYLRTEATNDPEVIKEYLRTEAMKESLRNQSCKKPP